MSSPNSPFLTHPEHYDEIERDDELWTEYVSIAADADKQLIDEWMKLVDTILVFDALFIGVLSAFILSPANSLQRNPTSITNDILVQIYAQLSNISAPPVDLNSFFIPNQQWSAVHSNSLLYPSLALAIIASMLGTSAKLWLIRYSRRVASSGTPYERAIRRQETYNGVVAWRLREIIESLPLLISMAVVLFALYIHFSILLDTGLAYEVGIMFSLGLLFILIASIFAAFFPTAPFQSPVSDFIRFIFRIFPNYPLPDFHMCPNILRISSMILVSVALAVIAAIWTIRQYSLAYLTLLCVPLACVVALSNPHPEKNDKMKPRIYGLPAWALFSCCTTIAALCISARLYETPDRPTLFIISFSFACALIPVQGYYFIQLSNSAPDTTTAKAVTWMLMNSSSKNATSKNATWFRKVARIGSSEVKRAVLLKDLLPLLSPLITSIPHHHPPDPDQVSYVECLARLCDFEPSTGSFWGNLWRNEVAFPLPIFSEDLKKKLMDLRGCRQCPPEVQDHASHALDFSENIVNSKPVEERLSNTSPV